MPTDVSDRVAEIHAKGREAFLVGNVPLFAGRWPEELRKSAIAAFTFDRESLSVARRRIIAPLQDLEVLCGCRFFLADRDFPLHATLLVWDHGTEFDYVKHGNFLRTDSFQICRNRFQDFVLNFHRVVLDERGNVLLVSNDIPDVVGVAHAALRYCDGLTARPQMLLHCTVAKTVELPGVGTGNYSPEQGRWRRERLVNGVKAIMPPKNLVHFPAIELRVLDLVGENLYRFLKAY